MSANTDLIAITQNFARWAAARAIQQRIGGLKSQRVFSAWEQAGLSGKLERAAARTRKWASDEYDRQHQGWCEELVDAIRLELERANKPKVSFGLAAKFINVYTKIAFVLPHRSTHSSFISVAHPPIDRALMKLFKDRGHRGFPEAPWTKFTAQDYGMALSALRSAHKSDLNLWRIETEWTGV